MANPLIHQITSELDTLQKQLNQFKATVEYLQGARDNIKDAVVSVNHAEAHLKRRAEELGNTYSSFLKLSESVSGLILKIDTIDFPNRLDSIERTVKDTIEYLNEIRKATLDELQKASALIVSTDFEGQFQVLKEAIKESSHICESIINLIDKQKLPYKIDGLENSINKKIDSSVVLLEKISSENTNGIQKFIQEFELIDKFQTISISFSDLNNQNNELLNQLKQVESMFLQELIKNSDLQNAQLDNLKIILQNSILDIDKSHYKRYKKLRNMSLAIFILLIVGFAFLFFTILYVNDMLQF